jgi:hypothetical protein
MMGKSGVAGRIGQDDLRTMTRCVRTGYSRDTRRAEKKQGQCYARVRTLLHSTRRSCLSASHRPKIFPQWATLANRESSISVLRIDTTSHRLVQLEAPTLTEASIAERYGLQELIYNSPDAFFTELGQTLFIIGKEVRPSNEVQDRIDLLALDEKGQAVIIELNVALISCSSSRQSDMRA